MGDALMNVGGLAALCGLAAWAVWANRNPDTGDGECSWCGDLAPDGAYCSPECAAAERELFQP